MSDLAVVHELGSIALPAPDWHRADALVDLLNVRCSVRSFSAEPLPLKVLSTLLWCAFGVNRPKEGGRVAPSAHDWQEIEVYVALAEGAYRYDAQQQLLHLVRTGDLRTATGMQEFAGQAPVDLVYVADFSKMTDASDEQRTFFAAADAGVVAQNVYLFCACTGLATVVRGMVDRRKLAPLLGLGVQQRIVLAQTVGYPAA